MHHTPRPIYVTYPGTVGSLSQRCPLAGVTAVQRAGRGRRGLGDTHTCATSAHALGSSLSEMLTAARAARCSSSSPCALATTAGGALSAKPGPLSRFSSFSMPSCSVLACVPRDQGVNWGSGSGSGSGSG